MSCVIVRAGFHAVWLILAGSIACALSWTQGYAAETHRADFAGATNHSTGAAAGASVLHGDLPGPIDEQTKQQKIYQSRGEQVPTGYVVDRALPSYVDAFSPHFLPALARLGAHDRWLDIGAGSGQAILDYHEPVAARLPELARLLGLQPGWARAHSVAISLEDRRRPGWHRIAAGLDDGRLRYLAARPLEDYSVAELGKFQLMTDLLGGFTYTDALSAYMAKALSFLEIDGSFHTLLQDVKSERGNNPPHYVPAPYTTELMTSEGAELGVCAWLKRIACVAVSCELKTDWKPSIEVYRIHKTCDRIEVPELVRSSYVAGTPPDRLFRLKY